MRGRPRKEQPNYYDGPAIPLTLECQRLRMDAKLGSAILREACLDLFQRTSNRYRINLSDAMACHLGFHAPVRLQRSPMSLCSGRA